MDARLVREGVGADDGLVALHHHAGHLADRRLARVQLAGVDARPQPVIGVAANLQRHDEFFQRAIARPLAQSVDGAFHAARPLRTAASELATASPRSL